jgi:hypothetical protein
MAVFMYISGDPLTEWIERAVTLFTYTQKVVGFEFSADTNGNII